MYSKMNTGREERLSRRRKCERARRASKLMKNKNIVRVHVKNMQEFSLNNAQKNYLS